MRYVAHGLFAYVNEISFAYPEHLVHAGVALKGSFLVPKDRWPIDSTTHFYVVICFAVVWDIVCIQPSSIHNTKHIHCGTGIFNWEGGKLPDLFEYQITFVRTKELLLDQKIVDLKKDALVL